MKEKKQRPVTKYLLFALLFVVTVAAALFFALEHKKASEENYSRMAEASIPLVYVNYNGNDSTALHGYVSQMSVPSMRDVIVPLDSDKTLGVTVLPYRNKVKNLSYEIRSLDGKEFMDGGTLSADKQDASRWDLRLKFSDLLVSGREYQLLLTVQTDDRPVYYYVRVLYAKTNYVDRLISFVKEFSDATYDAEKASMLVNYIQPDDSVPANDLYYTNIHSRYANFTYAGLEVRRIGNRSLRISELEPTQMSAALSYQIMLKPGEEWKTYSVSEFFVVRYRSGKIYLLDYYRTIEQVFEADKSTAESGRIFLGIGDGREEILTSENKTYTVFVVNKELWSYNTKTNEMRLIFSFDDDADTSGRSSYDHHDVQVVKISNTGDIDYMVYGYMNRGAYEGKVGICFYRYIAEQNATDRLFFMPVSQSEQMLMMDIGTLAYVNNDDVCYLRYGDGIYSIDLNSGESVEVSIRAYPGAYAMNKYGNVVAWQEGDDLKYPERLVILNMDTQTTAIVNAPQGEYVKLLDFIGDDVIYGFGRDSDSVIVANIDMQQLMTRIVIASTDEELKVQQNYEAADFFISDVRVGETRIVISRGRKNSAGIFSAIEDDYLLLSQNTIRDEGSSMVVSRVTEPQKKEYYIQIGSTTNHNSQFSMIVPRFENVRDANEITLLHEQQGAYYVYGRGTLLYVESDMNTAISEAYDAFGVVLDSSMNDLWTRGTRDLVHKISIQPYVSAVPSEGLQASLQVLCAQEGIQLSHVASDLEKGVSPFDIIDGAIGEGRAINLYGCTLQEVLYFININHPVICVIGNREAVVITGYDLDNVYVYYPRNGETKAETFSSAETFFRDYGNAFISYQ
ncbi:MAG: hypothetical protein IJM50_06255 [Lachnospiraceae bacterium]|nr:hypothetical protein [Lachnospiraceae bacterium]